MQLGERRANMVLAESWRRAWARSRRAAAIRVGEWRFVGFEWMILFENTPCTACIGDIEVELESEEAWM